MRLYECLYILNTEVADERRDAIKKKIEEVLDKTQGKIVSLEEWGKRKFCYEIKKTPKGYYYLMTFAAEPAAVTEMEHHMKISEDVLRYQTVLLKKHYQAAQA